MAQPVNRLPHEENERIINEALRRVRIMLSSAKLTLSQLEGGGSTAGGGFPLAAYTPITIAAGQTFTVPDNCQVLYAVPITVNGDLVIDGELVQVD